MKRKLAVQTAVSVGILVLLSSVSMMEPGKMGDNPGKLGNFLEKVGEAVRENYTLAELLELGENAALEMVSMPVRIGEAVVSVNEMGLYGKPLDEAAEDGEDGRKPVYAVAGGQVLRSGIRKDLGLYVMIEHPSSAMGTGKISTYGNLCTIRAAAGDRVKKGDIIGCYDSSCGEEFYYVLEEKSGNLN